MPKRDKAYMAGQRELIARAALAVLFEKGVHETSLRDICTRAGVSIGAFYNLFPTRADVIVAARHLDLVESSFIAKANDWQSYTSSMVAAFCDRSELARRRRRLSMQFAAEIMMMNHSLPGARALYDLQLGQITANLQAVFDKGEISLPLGLKQTVEIHTQLGLGVSYRLSNDLDLTAEQASATLIEGLKATAGFYER